MAATATSSHPNYIFKRTTTPKSERLLANSLGYPKSWHVVRKIEPNTGTDTETETETESDDETKQQHSRPNNKTCIDTIYSGDPKANVDTYYNHLAAYEAAVLWVEGTSTPYDRKGGQMLERKVEFELGDLVEVFYELDGNWYEAKVLKATQYQDAVRYTVHYTEDDSTQANIYEDQMRPLPKRKQKKQRNPPPSSKKKKQSGTTTTNNNNNNNNNKKRKANATKPPPIQPPAKKARKHQSIVGARPELFKPTPAALKLAKRMGLPKGWTAIARSNSRYTFRNPPGDLRFLSKKAVYEYLGLPIPPTGQKLLADSDSDGDDSVSSNTDERNGKTNSNKNNLDSDSNDNGSDDSGDGSSTETEDEEDESRQSQPQQPKGTVLVKKEGIVAEDDPEDGDPPWRNSGHRFIGRDVRYRFPDEDVGTHVGTVKGWIAAEDVDKDGEPGFISEQSGKPAALFHVRFDVTKCQISSQDLEEYELIKVLLPNVEDDVDDVITSDDDEKLSVTIKHVLKRGRSKPGRSRKK